MHRTFPKNADSVTQHAIAHRTAAAGHAKVRTFGVVKRASNRAAFQSHRGQRRQRVKIERRPQAHEPRQLLSLHARTTDKK